MRDMLWLLCVCVCRCVCALAAPAQQRFSVVPPAPTSNANHLFSSFRSLLRQQPNTLYPNGHSIVLGTVPRGTLLYHARKDAREMPQIEWLALDPEMSYAIIVPSSPLSYLVTFVATRPLRVIYLDGMSAALGEPGWLDSQSVLMYRNVTQDRSWIMDEFSRARGLCELGEQLGFEGVIRMNTGFELLWCNFDIGLEMVSRANITNPYNSDDHPYFSASLETDVQPLSERRKGPDEAPGNPNRRQPRFPPRLPSNDTRRLPFPRRRHPQTPWSSPGPFTATAAWEWERSGGRHNDGEPRVKLDWTSWVSFYDPDLTSLADRGPQRDSHRLVSISDADVSTVFRRLEMSIKLASQADWRIRHDALDWMGIVDTIQTTFGPRLEELRWVLTGNSLTATEKATEAMRLVFFIVMPFLDTSTFSIDSTEWIDSSKHRCQAAFTAGIRGDLTHGEKLIKSAVEGVMDRICEDSVRIFKEVMTLRLPQNEETNLLVPDSLTTRWASIVKDLVEWLGWGSSVHCDRVCTPDEICVVPFWPLGGKGWQVRPPGQHPGYPGEDKSIESSADMAKAKCVSKDSLGK